VSSSFYLLFYLLRLDRNWPRLYRGGGHLLPGKKKHNCAIVFFCCVLATPCSVCVGGVLLIRIVLRHTQNKSPTIFFPTHVTLGDMAVGKEERL
jgi:hypothetical protein